MKEHDVGQDNEVAQEKQNKPQLEVPVAWEALEDAFENNAPEVHSYLHFDTGEVIRIVDGVADPAMHTRILSDARYLRIDPVSSREQYRWMERFIATVEEPELARRLNVAIDGKGAFRRFKDALMSHPIDRERWFAFRSERLRSCMESWLTAHGVRPVERPKWHVPTADEVQPDASVIAEATTGSGDSATQGAAGPTRSEVHTPRGTGALAPGYSRPKADDPRRALFELVGALGPEDLETARAFLQFLIDRGPSRRPEAIDATTPEVAAATETSKAETH